MTVVIWLLDSRNLLLAAAPLLMYRLLVILERPLTEGCRDWVGKAHVSDVIKTVDQQLVTSETYVSFLKCVHGKLSPAAGHRSS